MLHQTSGRDGSNMNNVHDQNPKEKDAYPLSGEIMVRNEMENGYTETHWVI